MPGGVAAQTRQAVENLDGQLASMGATLADVAKTLCFLTDMDTFADVQRGVRGRFRRRPPGAQHHRCGRAALEGAVEIEAWAYSPPETGPSGARVDLPVPGAIAIVVVLVAAPRGACMGSAAIAAVLGFVLNRDAEVRGEGSELLDLNVCEGGRTRRASA